MILLGAKLYDPAVAVNKVTTAAIAMTALDTTNLRIAFTIPSHGMVRVKLAGSLHGATTFPSILLGVMNGATVVGRVSPQQTLGNTAVATAQVRMIADFCVTGLTPGAVSWDAAYGVETLIAATGLKYGGPNNTTANDAFGAFQFEVWDPAPASIGSVTGSVGSVTGAVGSVTGNVGGNVVGSVASVTGAVGSVSAAVTVGANNDKTGYSLTSQNWAVAADIPSIAAIADGVWDEVTSGHQTAGTTGKALSDAGSAGDPWGTTLPGTYGAGTAGNKLGNLTGGSAPSASEVAAAVHAGIGDKVFGYTP